jgi:hypothetical protein
VAEHLEADRAVDRAPGQQVVDVRHQFDQDYVIDATATTETFGLTATPWEQVVAASVAGPQVPATR